MQKQSKNQPGVQYPLNSLFYSLMSTIVCHLKRKLFKSTIMPVLVLISIVKDWYKWLVFGLVHLLSNDPIKRTGLMPCNMLTTLEIQVQITLNIDIISRITNDYDVLWRKLRSKWVELVSVKRCTCLFTNTLKMITRRITSLILFRRRNYLQFFTFWIFFNPTNYASLYLTIYSFILECVQFKIMV